MRNGLLAIGLLGGLLIGQATPAGAGAAQPNWIITSELRGYADVLVLSVENVGRPCTGATTTVGILGEDDTTLAEVPLSGQNSGTFVVPDDLSQTIFELEVSCTTASGEFTRPVIEARDEPSRFLADYAGLDVTKVVEGDVPDGTEFTVNIDCTTGSGDAIDVGPYDLTFDAEGGTNRVWFSYGHLCELDETDDGGADSTTYVSEDCAPGDGPVDGNGAESVAISGPEQCDATVTNVFAGATTTSTTASTTTTSAPDGGVDSSTATPATPTVANPTFTG